MSDRSNVLQRIVQLSHEIEKTYGFGKSYTISSEPVRGYTPEESERKERQNQRWLETAREWSRIRNPLIAEVQTIAELHRDDWPKLFEAVSELLTPFSHDQGNAWPRIRRIALEAGRRQQAGGPVRQNTESLGNGVPTNTEAQDNPSEPNAIGYVDGPADITAYVPVATIIADHCAEIGIKSPGEVVRVVEDYETYHIRWTRPRSPHTNRPHRQRRSVHLADWLTFARRSTNRDRVSNEQGFPDIHPDEVEARKLAVRRSAKYQQ